MRFKETLTHMCKSMRALGLSKRRQHIVENHLAKMLERSGPEFTISYLKDIRDYHVERASGINRPAIAPWHKKDRFGSPSGWQKLFHFRKPKTSIQILSAGINSIELGSVSKRQYEKWRDNVCEVTSPRELAESSELYFSYLFNEETSKKMDRWLAHEIAGLEFFQPADLTGTAIPTLRGTMRIADKHGHVNLERLMLAYVKTINSAPAVAGFLELDNIKLVEKLYPDIIIKDKEIRLELAQRIIDRGADILNEDSMRNPDTNLYAGLNQIVGSIAFLQQPGGKLRTIANPNRYLQHVMRPLQKTMSFVNSAKNVCVTDQQEGIEWAQRKLAEGYSLFSGDLSAATDTLRFEEYVDRWQLPQLLRGNIDSFSTVSRCEWNNPHTGLTMGWAQGQPLGLGPSFSMLTSMHLDIAISSAIESGIPTEFIRDSFRIVGDDIVMISEMAENYIEKVSEFGGLLNEDKCMLSTLSAEFCSQLITKSNVYPIKPKIGKLYKDIFVNLEKTDLDKLLMSDLVKRKDIDAARTLSEYSSDLLTNLPKSKSNNIRPLSERVGASLILSEVASLDPDDRFISLPASSLSMRLKGHQGKQSFVDLPDLKSIDDREFRLRVAPSTLKYDWKSNTYKVGKVSSYNDGLNLFRFLRSLRTETDDKVSLVILDDKRSLTRFQVLVDTDKGSIDLEVEHLHPNNSVNESLGSVNVSISRDSAFIKSLKPDLSGKTVKKSELAKIFKDHFAEVAPSITRRIVLSSSDTRRDNIKLYARSLSR